ncbi:hypothetical protein E5676_scaffold259G00650 [Cucumis melo var. makuwa]|uniref:NBS-LRR type resistance protein n=1 Tax=Cucumis melo var. makuwa TaxID=1194695 RepID=A0A5D3CUN8_CUCMM|nr:hypothetical protein E6C27_scaffold538G00630 [Cucumis melo var. makuwa]TYK15130.1 hypothetical protein E5676_scaffold259G00650 [Cucumis melo var. makuwa]
MKRSHGLVDAHINQSSNLQGHIYQSSDPVGYTYQSSDPEGCTTCSDPVGHRAYKARSGRNRVIRTTVNQEETGKARLKNRGRLARFGERRPDAWICLEKEGWLTCAWRQTWWLVVSWKTMELRRAETIDICEGSERRENHSGVQLVVGGRKTSTILAEERVFDYRWCVAGVG